MICLKKEYIEIGRIGRSHGVLGEFRLECFCDDANMLSNVKTVFSDECGGVFSKVQKIRGSGKFAFVKLENINSPEEAKKYVNRSLFAKREEINIKDGKFFICELLGLDVVDIDTNKKLGTLTEVLDSKAGQIFSVKTEGGDVLVPNVSETNILIKPIGGMFDMEDL